MPDFSIETNLEHPVIGLDEVGRGPLAGPVVSCGCYFKNYKIQDSLSEALKNFKFTKEIKLTVDVDPISFN